MYTFVSGVVRPGFQMASGGTLGPTSRPSPFSAGTLTLQDPHFRARGLDLAREVPGLAWGTINVELAAPLALGRPDITLEGIDWTRDEPDPASRLQPETFSFVHCGFAHKGRFHAGMIYYPHPETKLSTNTHDPRVLEVLAAWVGDLAIGDEAAIVFRSDAFRKAWSGLDQDDV